MIELESAAMPELPPPGKETRTVSGPRRGLGGQRMLDLIETTTVTSFLQFCRRIWAESPEQEQQERRERRWFVGIPAASTAAELYPKARE